MCSIVTESLSPAIFAIIGTKHIEGYDLDLPGSLDVISYVTIGFAMVQFLLLVLWIQV